MRLRSLVPLTALASAAVAGNLNPPLAPNSTMLPLNQVEPRTPITSIPTTINNPGSYFLIGNLTGSSGQSGITVAADHVTIDLRGFSLAGVTGSLDGISVPAARVNLQVFNGTVRNWGSDAVAAGNAANSLFADLRITACGDNGLVTGTNCVVERVVVENTDDGILTGDNCIVRNCNSSFNLADGIEVGRSARLVDCTVRENDGDGLRGNLGAAITGCVSGNNDGDGIEVLGRCTVEGNTCDSHDSTASTAGIRVTGEDNVIRGNTLTNNRVGIDADGTGNLVVGNADAVSSGFGGLHTPYIVDTDTNTVGPSAGPGPLGSASPLANITY